MLLWELRTRAEWVAGEALEAPQTGSAYAVGSAVLYEEGLQAIVRQNGLVERLAANLFGNCAKTPSSAQGV